MKDLLSAVAENRYLTRSEAARGMRLMLSGEASAEQIAGLLLGLRARGESLEELIGLTQAMRSMCLPVSLPTDIAVDIVGTGGDGSGTFNISTTTAFVAAGAGVPVAKHGNRSISSKCGSSDVLEALGIRTEMDTDEISACLSETGITFMFAPTFHTALRHVMPVRRALGVRTCFNILGPLCNPASVRRHFIGAFDLEVVRVMADILHALGSSHIVAVHSDDGMDELSVSGPNTLIVYAPGSNEPVEERMDPSEFGFERATLADLAGGDALENAQILRRILDGEQGHRRNVVLLNTAGALRASGAADSMESGLQMAADSIDTGKAAEKLEQILEFSRSLGPK